MTGMTNLEAAYRPRLGRRRGDVFHDISNNIYSMKDTEGSIQHTTYTQTRTQEHT